MKKSYILLSGLILAGAAFTSCDDEKQLTLDAPEAKLLQEITFEVSDVLPLAVGMDSTLVYKVGPEDADDKTVIFSTSDESVATVDQDGTIRALKVGDATISAMSSLGFNVYEAQAAVQVHVIPEVIKITSITLTNETGTGEDGNIYVTDELQFSAKLLPEDCTYTRLVWGTSDPSVATVDETGFVKCVGEGTCDIIALATDRSGIKGTYTLNVKKYIAATGVQIAELPGSVCISDGAFNLDVTYSPAGATLGSVDWVSDDESVATVHRGRVTPKGFGSCNITATCVENGTSATVRVTVEPGFYHWDASNQWQRWILSGNNTREERTDKYWRVYFPDANGGKWRQDFKIDCGNNNLFEMRLATYPVLAVRMTKMNGGNATLDCVFDGYGNAGNPNPHNGIDLGDGTQLLIYNLGAAKNYAGVDQALFRVFQIKLADIPNENVDPAKAWYDIFWIRTFKTEDDAKAFAQDQVNRGE